MLLQNRLYFLDTSISHYPNINGRILSCFPDGSDLQEVVTQIQSRPDGIAVDAVNQHIYWTNQGIQDENNGSIQRCDCDGRNIITIIPKGITWTPKQLKLAPVSKKLYWSDREGMRVMRANLDGSDVEVLHQTGQGEVDKQNCCNWCVGITVDEENGYVYWSQKGPARGGQGRILRMPIPIHEPIADFQPAKPEVLLYGLPEPIDLDFDVNRQQIWWTDRGDPPFGNTVNTVTLRDLKQFGISGRKIMARRLRQAIGISLDMRREKVYFADMDGGVYVMNYDGSDHQVLFHDVGNVTGVAIVG